MLSRHGFVRMSGFAVLTSATLLCVASRGARAQQYQDPEKAATPAQEKSAAPRYANMPDAAVPYRNFTKPYKEWFVTDDTIAYNGAARDRASEELEQSETVNIGFLGPLQNNPESPYGVAMLHGAQLRLPGCGCNARKALRVEGASGVAAVGRILHGSGEDGV